MKVIFFHRNTNAGYSINKVTQTIIRDISDKEEYYMPSAGSSVRDILTNLRFVRKHRSKDAIHHITGDIHYGILGLIGYRSVLTIHDTIGLDFLKMNGVKSFIYKLLWFRIPIRLSTRILCISEVTRSYVKKYTSRKDIRVIHDAIDTTLQFMPSKPIMRPVKILFIGTKENKNLIRCFDALKGLNCHVTIIGKLKPEQIESLKNNCISYTNKFNLSNDDLNKEYYDCDIVSFCSLFEGFGMPALEGNQVGRPVLCSTIPVLKEVAGDAACYADPNDTASIREGYLRIINNDEYRLQLIENGKKNIVKYLPSVIKKEWEEIYKEISLK